MYRHLIVFTGLPSDGKTSIAKALEKLGISPPKPSEIELESPPEGLGDFAYPCFSLAPVLKKNPNQIASEIAEAISPQLNISFKATGPYLNFTIADDRLVQNVVSVIFSLGEAYGQLTKKGVKVILTI